MQTEWRPGAASHLSLHVLVEFHGFFQTGQPPPQVGLVRHLALVLHDLVSGFRHDVLDLSGRDTDKMWKELMCDAASLARQFRPMTTRVGVCWGEM